MIREDRSSGVGSPTFGRSICLCAAVVTVASLLVASRADDRVLAPSPPPVASGSVANALPASIDELLGETPAGTTGEKGSSHPLPPSGPVVPRAVVKLIGTAAPGLRVALDGSASTGHS